MAETRASARVQKREYFAPLLTRGFLHLSSRLSNNTYPKLRNIADA